MKRGMWMMVVVGLLAVMVAVAPAYAAEKGGRGGATLPAAAKDAITKAYAEATVGRAKAVEENGVKAFEVKVVAKDKSKMEVTVAEDGTILCAETEMKEDALPEAVKKAVADAKKDGTVRKTERVETMATAKDGKVEKMAAAKVTYKASIVAKGGKSTVEVRIAEDGTVIGTEEVTPKAHGKKHEPAKEKPAAEAKPVEEKK